jgi:hypothetical protein
MTDLTMDRAAALGEPVRSARLLAMSEQRADDTARGPATSGVRLTRLLALAGLSPSQAVEVGATLLAAVGEQVEPNGGLPAIDRIMVGTDGRVVIDPAPENDGARAATSETAGGVAALLGQVAAACRGRPTDPGAALLLDELDNAVITLPFADVSAVRQRLEEACAGVDRRVVRAELAALVRALAQSTGSAVAHSTAGPERVGEERPGGSSPVRLAPALRTRVWAWVLSVAVLAAVVALEVVLLRDDIAADVHLLLDAGRSGSTVSTAPEPVAPPAAPTVGAVAGVDVRPLTACVPDAPCTVRVLLRLVPGADPRTVSWSFQLTDRCTGATDTASGGSVTVPAGEQQIAVVDTVPVPYRAVGVVAVTEQPAVAAAPPLLLGSCTSG